MKKALLITALSAIAFAGNAQTFNETFDSNTMGWTEEASSRGEALVKDGVLHLVSKGTTMMSSCYTNEYLWSFILFFYVPLSVF